MGIKICSEPSRDFVEKEKKKLKDQLKMELKDQLKMEIEKKICEIVEKLDSSFWELWNKEIDIFPDVEEADYLKMLILQVALSTIVSNYLLGYDRSCRTEELEIMIDHFRSIEMRLRDIQ